MRHLPVVVFALLMLSITLGAFNEIHHPEFIDHIPSGRAQDRDGFRQGIQALYRAFPDFMGQIDDLVVDPTKGKVSIRWTAVGTHHEELLDVPPTGRRIRFAGIEIIDVKDHQVVARWGGVGRVRHRGAARIDDI